MKLSKTMKKFMAVVCTFALVVSSLAVNNFVKADDGSWAFTSTSYQTNAEKTQYNITVNYSAYQGAEPDGYYYSIYVDEEADGNIGIASNGWDWGKAQGRHGFDTVYKTKEGEAFKPGETHKIIVVAYEKNEDESFTRLDSIETEITLPAELPTLSQEEQERKEMEDACVSDANLAKGTTGFVSWNEDPAPALVDGNLGSGTGNSSVKGENDFVGVNLGEVKTIGSIITKFESACPAEFVVYVAGADGVYGDTPVATNIATGANPIVKTTFAAVEAQYVKVVQTVPSELSTMYGMNAFELAVFAGEKTPENPETTPAEVETTTPAEVETTTPAEVETTTPAEVETTTLAEVETTTPAEVETTTPAEVETTTPAEVDTTTPAVVETTTEAPKTTTAAPKVTTKKALGKTTVKSASKKKAATKVKLTFKKVKGAKKYQVQISKTKKFKKVLVKKTVRKVSVTIKSKKIKNQKKLYVRIRAVGAKKWSKAKKIKIKK